MSDQSADPVGEETQDTLEAPDSGASLVPDADAAPEAPVEVPAWQREWNTDDPMVALERQGKSYNELRSRFSAGEHKQQAEPEPEPEPYDPYADLPPDDDERTVRQLATLWEHQGPKQVFAWIDDPRNAGLVSEQTKGQFFAAWAQQDQLSAQRYVAEMVHNQRQEEWEQRWEQRIAPVQQHVQAQKEAARAESLNTAVAMAKQGIPDWDQWEPQIVSYLGWLATSDPEYVDYFQKRIAPNPATLSNWLKQVQEGLLRQQHEQNTSTQNGTAPPPPAGAATQTRSKTSTGPQSAREKHRADVEQSLRTIRT